MLVIVLLLVLLTGDAIYQIVANNRIEETSKDNRETDKSSVTDDAMLRGNATENVLEGAATGSVVSKKTVPFRIFGIRPPYMKMKTIHRW